jgi:NAD(P)-dependent dehydrogenase (short-subunit alcohol dehydrogenase family)
MLLSYKYKMYKTYISAAPKRGKAIATRLAHDGFSVCLNDVPASSTSLSSTLDKLKQISPQSQTTSFIADVSQNSQVASLIRHTVETLGPLKVMVANAGISKIKPILEQTEQDMRQMLDVNFMGVWNCYTLAAKQMIAQLEESREKIVPGGKNAGKIIGAASLAAFRPFVYLGHYAATKHAVRGFTQSLALEVARFNITANAYAPGVVDTPMWAESDAEIARREGKKPRDALEVLRGQIALGRLSEGEDVAKVVSFLAGSDSDYLTGQTLIVDGGMHFS